MKHKSIVIIISLICMFARCTWRGRRYGRRGGRGRKRSCITIVITTVITLVITIIMHLERWAIWKVRTQERKEKLLGSCD